LPEHPKEVFISSPPLTAAFAAPSFASFSQQRSTTFSKAHLIFNFHLIEKIILFLLLPLELAPVL